MENWRLFRMVTSVQNLPPGYTQRLKSVLEFFKFRNKSGINDQNFGQEPKFLTKIKILGKK